ncbi:hypothetical protein JCM16303_006270 [Sporobolomyces ruberrimus]
MLRRLFGAQSTARTASAPYSASNIPAYVYKIVVTPKSNPRYTFPIPIPASHEFVLSELDAKDGFIHLSSAPQLHQVLSRFFSSETSVLLLKIDYARLSGFKVVKWEQGGSNGEEFPHLYRTLEGEYVESVEELQKGENQEKEWERALEELEKKGWLE